MIKTHQFRGLLIRRHLVFVGESGPDLVHQLFPDGRILSGFVHEIDRCDGSGVASREQEYDGVLYQVFEGQLAATGLFISGIDEIAKESVFGKSVAFGLELVLEIADASLNERYKLVEPTECFLNTGNRNVFEPRDERCDGDNDKAAERSDIKISNISLGSTLAEQLTSSPYHGA